MRSKFDKCPTGGFTLIEMMIVLLILSALMAIAIPNYMKARDSSRVQTCISNLTHIERAKELFSLEHRMPNGAIIGWGDLVPASLKNQPDCPSGGEYRIEVLGTNASCSIDEHILP